MCPVTESRVPVHVASVIPSEVGIQQKVGNADSQLAPLEALSSLVTRLLRTAQESRLVDGKVPPEEVLGSSSAVPTVGGAERGHSVMERGRVFLVRTPGTRGEPMFAGGHFFSVLAAGLVGGCPGWPISSDTDRRNWNVVYSGKRGMVRTGGSASRIIGDRSTTDPGGGDRREAGRLGSCRWGVGFDPVGLRARTLFRHWGAIPRMFVGRITDSCRSGPRWCWETGT